MLNSSSAFSLSDGLGFSLTWESDFKSGWNVNTCTNIPLINNKPVRIQWQQKIWHYVTVNCLNYVKQKLWAWVTCVSKVFIMLQTSHLFSCNSLIILRKVSVGWLSFYPLTKNMFSHEERMKALRHKAANIFCTVNFDWYFNCDMIMMMWYWREWSFLRYYWKTHLNDDGMIFAGIWINKKNQTPV